MARENEDTVVVFTARGPERVIAERGSQGWVLNRARAAKCKYLVCTQNQNNPDPDFTNTTEPRGSAFLVGKISQIVPSWDGDRWLIEISEYARVSKPDVWKHWRNPVRYTSLSELEIKIDDLEFEPMPEALQTEPRRETATAAPTTLTIAEAKRALAATFGVKPEAVEITIRG